MNSEKAMMNLLPMGATATASRVEARYVSTKSVVD